MANAAESLAAWAADFQPSDEDLALADRALKDTIAVAYAARQHPLKPLFDQLTTPGRNAALAHVLDFDDLHMPSTTHISAICVPAALANSDRPGRARDARAYVTGAGVMARLGTALGWRHYTAGWHATCTAGAPAAAVAAATAQGATKAQLATAIALAIPAAGGVQRAFGTAAKALQVGYAAEAGVRAANLAAAGASADPRALDDWIALVQGDPELSPERLAEPQTPAVPGGLAIKLYPCCYALQRPIAALAELHPLDPDDIRKITVTTPEGSLQPLIHKNPQTGLEGKFSLEYGIAAALLDHRPDLNSFEDAAVQRAEAQELIEKVQISPTGGQSNGLLDGEIQVDIELATGESKGTALKLPPGAPERPPTNDELQAKLEACAGDRAEDIASLTWETAQAFLAEL